MSGIRKRVRALMAEAASLGVAVDDVVEGQHIKLRLVLPDGTPASLVLAKTPSDTRSDMNARAQLRRMARSVG